MDKGIVLDLLDPVHLAVSSKQLLQALLSDGVGEVLAVEDPHLVHGLLVGLLLGVRPVQTFMRPVLRRLLARLAAM